MKGGGFVEVVDITREIFIYSQEIVGLYVPHKVGAENKAAVKLLLKTNIHHYGARRLIIRIIHTRGQAESQALIQERTNVVRIWRAQIEDRICLVLLLECSNLVSDCTYRDRLRRLYPIHDGATKSGL